MRIIGVDPGMQKGCGICDCDFAEDRARVQTFVAPRSVQGDDALLAAWYAETIATWAGPVLTPHRLLPPADAVAIEGQFAPIAKAKDPKRRKAQMGIARAATRLSKLVGGIMAILASQGIRVIEIAPATGKHALTGDGKASPGEMDTWARRLYAFPKLTDDEAHACGIALAGQRVLLLERKRAPERKKVGA